MPSYPMTSMLSPLSTENERGSKEQHLGRLTGRTQRGSAAKRGDERMAHPRVSTLQVTSLYYTFISAE